MLCVKSETTNRLDRRCISATNLSWFSSWVRSVLTGLAAGMVLRGGIFCDHRLCLCITAIEAGKIAAGFCNDCVARLAEVVGWIGIGA